MPAFHNCRRNLGLLNLFSRSTMPVVEVPSPKDPEIVESLLLDLLDPENKAYALSVLPKVIYFSSIFLFHLPLIHLA